MARLSKRERDQEGEREGMEMRTFTEDRKKLPGRLMSEKLCFVVY